MKILSEFVCDAQCMKSWLVDPRQYKKERLIKIGVVATIIIFFIIVGCAFWLKRFKITYKIIIDQNLGSFSALKYKVWPFYKLRVDKC